jgi:CrcB protein
MPELRMLLAVGLGGAVGSIIRLCIARLPYFQAVGTAFPWSTLLVNLSGCLLIGLLYQFGLHQKNFSPTLMVGLTTGVLGGLTTFSTFGLETWIFLEQGNLRMAVIYIGSSLFGGLACLGTGWLIGGWLNNRLLI